MFRAFALISATSLTLAACSQPEPEPVYMQPTFDKAGNAHCMDGYGVASTDTGATVCMPDA